MEKNYKGESSSEGSVTRVIALQVPKIFLEMMEEVDLVGMRQALPPRCRNHQLQRVIATRS